MKRNSKLILILTLFFVFSCKNEDGLSPNDSFQPESKISVVNTTVKTFEIINVKSSISDLQDIYSGTFGNTELQLAKVNDSILVFIVPDVELGVYELKTELGNIEFNVSKTRVANSEEVITTVFTAFDNEVNSMGNSPELDGAKTFKNDVTKLYNSLSTEQKKEVAMFYEANKEIFQAFKQDLSTTYNAPTTFKRKTIQSDCPKIDFKSFYSCTGDNLGNSINKLGVSIKKIAEPIAYAAAIGKLASATWYLGPAVWGLTAVGASLSIGTAMYILVTEVRPAWIDFKSNLTPFLKANWILAEATFDVVTDEFSSNNETDLNLDAKFRTIEETDNDISSETSFFISAYSKLNFAWNNFSKVLGNIPSFTSSEEAIELETSDITISNISNSNVELVSQNGEKVKFESLSGSEENFNFEITVSKEGFTHTRTVNATVSATDPCLNNNAPVITSFKRACNSDKPNTIVYKLTFTADGVGFTNKGSYFGSAHDGKYPVRLEFRTSPTGPFSTAANSYTAYLSNGDIYDGEITIEVKMGSFYYCSPLSSESPVYWHDQWRVHLIDDCGLSSSNQTFNLFYYSRR